MLPALSYQDVTRYRGLQHNYDRYHCTLLRVYTCRARPRKPFHDIALEQLFDNIRQYIGNAPWVSSRICEVTEAIDFPHSSNGSELFYLLLS